MHYTFQLDLPFFSTSRHSGLTIPSRRPPPQCRPTHSTEDRRRNPAPGLSRAVASPSPFCTVAYVDYRHYTTTALDINEFAFQWPRLPCMHATPIPTKQQRLALGRRASSGTSLRHIKYTHAIASAIALHANISQSEYNIDSFQSHKYKNKDCAECDQFIADWEAGGVRQLLYSGSVE